MDSNSLKLLNAASSCPGNNIPLAAESEKNRPHYYEATSVLKSVIIFIHGSHAPTQFLENSRDSLLPVEFPTILSSSLSI